MINKVLHPFLKALRESEYSYEKMLGILENEFEKLKENNEQKNQDRNKEKQVSTLSG